VVFWALGGQSVKRTKPAVCREDWLVAARVAASVAGSCAHTQSISALALAAGARDADFHRIRTQPSGGTEADWFRQDRAFWRLRVARIAGGAHGVCAAAGVDCNRDCVAVWDHRRVAPEFHAGARGGVCRLGGRHAGRDRGGDALCEMAALSRVAGATARAASDPG